MKQRNVINFFRISIFFLICTIAYSCATPSAPTGGPRDEESPEIIRTEPETGTINFDDDKIILHFSEFVERSSLTEALTIEPDIGLVYGLDWGRKSVAIEFDNQLPDLTTLIVTVGTEFSDLNNNQLASPFKVAVSTGPDIDKGKLTGRILDARTGKGAAGKRVLLYRTPADLTQPANYIGETDTSGVVNFSYLRQGAYKAFWVDDRNRNKIWEPDRERAQPFGQDTVSLAKAGSDTLGTLFIADSDTSLPNLQGLGLFSSKRLRLRFSENVVIRDSTRLGIRDTTGTPLSGAYPLYVSPADQYVLFAQSEQELDPTQNYQLMVRNIADVAGNVQRQSVQNFTGSAQEDTTAQRIVGTSAFNGIYADESIEITYAKPITSAAIRDSIKIVEGNNLRESWKGLQIERNKVYIQPDGRWKRGVDYELRVWNPVLSSYRSITPTIWYESDLGALHVVLEDTAGVSASRTTHLILNNKEGQTVADTSFTKQVEISDLAPVNHQLILFQDLNGNGQWDGGQVIPYKAPEPYYIRNDVPVQRGFTSDLTVSFENL
ncbi:MAG: Ig-like domain-containing protein [Balneolaceae bacterium]|nr:Ig-like domain-containing protein [Balneolaceae bacterium]